MSRKIGFASVKGASGTSTAALSVSAAAAVQGPVTLVEADPSGGSLLSWCDDLRPAGDLYDAAMSRDPGGSGCDRAAPRRRRGGAVVGPPVSHRSGADAATCPWDLLFDEDGGDRGRRSRAPLPGRPHLGGAQAMDVIVLVSASEPGPVAATMEWAGRGGRHAAGDVGVSTDRIVMVTNEVVGRRRVSVTPREMASLHGPPYLGHFEHDEAAWSCASRRVGTASLVATQPACPGRHGHRRPRWPDRAGLALSPEGVGGEPGEGRSPRRPGSAGRGPASGVRRPTAGCRTARVAP